MLPAFPVFDDIRGTRVSRGSTPIPFPSAVPWTCVRRYHKALVLALVCFLVVGLALARAYLQAPKRLTSAEVLAATRIAVRRAVDVAIGLRGLDDAPSFVRNGIAEELRRHGFRAADVALVRPNDLNPFAAFYFMVNVSGL